MYKVTVKEPTGFRQMSHTRLNPSLQMDPEDENSGNRLKKKQKSHPKYMYLCRCKEKATRFSNLPGTTAKPWASCDRACDNNQKGGFTTLTWVSCLILFTARADD